MSSRMLPLLLFAFLPALPLSGQITDNPLPDPIEAEEGLVVVGIEEFAVVPDADGQPARMMLLVDEPGTGRMFVNDMVGPLYSLSYEGGTAVLYLDLDDPEWEVMVESAGRERGFQSFAFHPEFGESGAPGFGKFYTFTDSYLTDRPVDFDAGPDGGATHHTVLHEWTAEDPTADIYDGGAPREVMRFEQPFPNHNAGHLAFDPLAEPGDSEYGLLYIGSADGGSGGDPLNLSQNLSNAFGKVLRIDPLGSDSPNGQYGIPADNHFASDGQEDTLGEIYAVGVRNPQRFWWDPANGNMFLADIGQSIIEKVSLVTNGANLGWNDWEGSFRYLDRTEVRTDDVRSDPSITYPVVEYGHYEPLVGDRVAVTGGHAYRADEIPQLQGLVLFSDFPSGEIFYFDGDDLPDGGQDGLRRVLLRDGSGESRTFLELVQQKNLEQGRVLAERTDLRFGTGPNDWVFLLNKHDGTIRRLVP